MMKDTLTFSLIQTDLAWENPECNLAMLETKMNGLVGKTEVVVLPEMFSTGFTMQPHLYAQTMDGDTVKWMQALSKKLKIIIAGSLSIEENGQYYNRLIWMLPNGQLGYYNKRHLFAYANEHQHYTPGNSRSIAQINGWKINLQICYDLRFPVWARQQPAANEAAEYDVLLYVANWPDKRSHAWSHLLTARAIENQCYVIGVNRVGTDGHQLYHSGNSCVIDAMGETLYQCAHSEDITTITLHKAHLQQVRANMPFLNDADSFLLIP